ELDEVQRKLARLEDDILALVQKFEQEAGYRVSQIDPITLSVFGSQDKTRFIGVTIKSLAVHTLVREITITPRRSR
ncbi:MAG TPA: hypothetical protein VFO27_14600, partial [Bryobacteraceae bacterium]|nr:hypothetical protein [Bryobacteraceae bacterium]